MMMGFMRQVLDTLAEIQERHEAVKELEKSLMELHQIFLDMAVLVEAQGEMLDNIENQVSATHRPVAPTARIDSICFADCHMGKFHQTPYIWCYIHSFKFACMHVLKVAQAMIASTANCSNDTPHHQVAIWPH